MDVQAIRTVSVPLRGCGFEMKTLTIDNPRFDMFPSPCGDVVLKSQLESPVSI